MKGFILMFMGTCHLFEAFGVTHSLKYFYTASSGVPNFPEFMVVGMVDGVQMVHYDSNSQRMVPEQDWMNKQTEAEYWERETGIAFDSQQVFKDDVNILKQRFNQSGGVHVLQYIYGCSWDDETEQRDGFGQLGYNGEDFLVYDMNTLTWKALKQQADVMRDKWNRDISRLVFWKTYFSQTCIECLKKQVVNGKSTLRTVPPSVSLLQKTPSSPVTCHATGFYPSGVMVFWQKDGQEQHEDVEHGEILHNDDGTFQKSTHLRVTPEEWKNNKYQCVVQVTGIKEDFIKVLTESEIQTNWGDPAPIIVPIIGGVVALLLVVVVVGVVIWKKKSKKGFVPASTNDTDSVYSGKDLLKT
ncbi:H-2 class I histocompatibility antigen, Q9 alpha chain isoform X1 [Salmo salar]|uniref:H-2 class I histocompatibility antigen, Q9 alpha chain isoform X1 n=3 Tax=Salmo salar TaxID=8030 RepID=A0ABM3CVP9_SALSA|nr:H-2 class I histocompatibility antigen, Q9 alpha chain isoform X1 [Salmo salar]XP_045550628.1 H-2 class I histocompatibility antigen, Q9 alpha chain isoform X1 [Salmo salar]